MKISVRDYSQSDAETLIDIFYEAVHEVAIAYYSPAEVNVWAPLPRDHHYWKRRFDYLRPYVAEIEGEAVGFITLENNGHIDLMYTRKGYQRMGVASALYAYAEKEARKKGIARLYVEASHLAKPFFEKKGFAVVCRNEIKRNEQIIVNWSMKKFIAS